MHQNASCCRILFVYHNHMENYFTQFPAGQKIEAPDGLLDKVMLVWHFNVIVGEHSRRRAGWTSFLE